MTPPSGARSQFKRWLTAPPRPHGALIKDRTVSTLELFDDLVSVAVIKRFYVVARYLRSGAWIEVSPPA